MPKTGVNLIFSNGNPHFFSDFIKVAMKILDFYRKYFFDLAHGLEDIRDAAPLPLKKGAQICNFKTFLRLISNSKGVT